MTDFISVTLLIVWLPATIAVYKTVRKLDDNSAFTDFIGSLMFWWLVLPVFVCRVAWLAAPLWVEQFVKWRRRKLEPERKSGLENGLYD